MKGIGIDLKKPKIPSMPTLVIKKTFNQEIFPDLVFKTLTPCWKGHKLAQPFWRETGQYLSKLKMCPF